MHFTCSYRRIIASLLAVWMCMIIISGVIFMHKEVASTGEIVTHIHPYDFTKNKSKQKHHESDDEIQFLNVVYQGTFIDSDIIVFTSAILCSLTISGYKPLIVNEVSTATDHNFLRGPPYLA
ncbi:hypothetical protein ACR782_18210 [Sphingobacterium spiritivorum]